tara:strand:- start:351 stop:1517 length:1167 start_codon:yes stop_codon:yes gene_type:complete
MLEQAIADAAALREQAIKNAEQSVIEKYSHQIKEAVDVMLENNNLNTANSMIQEAEEELNEEADAMPASFAGGQEGATIEAPPAWDSRYDDMSVKFNALVDSLPQTNDGMIDLDLGEFEMSAEEEEAMGGSDDAALGGLDDSSEPAGDLAAEPEGDDTSGGDESLDDLLATLQEGKEINEEDVQLDEILNMLEEELHMEDGEDVMPSGNWTGNGKPERTRAADAAQIQDVQFGEEESEEESSEEDDSAATKQTELYETIEALANQNEAMANVLEKLETHLDEALLSNAKLLYQNRTLGDASLNERQKSKIVDAIANAESMKEAKQLQETLKATVGSTPNGKKGPQSLSESVNRRSNLSSMLNPRQNINESKTAQNPFMEKMQKLAGIK